MPELETKSLRGVEVFAAGEWNGDRYSVSDLDKLADAFSATKDALKPYIKLGHGDKQVLLERDGLPAAGWIERLYRAGDKLLADIAGIPAKLADIIAAGGYKRVSSEIFIRPKVSGKVYDMALKAVAFLGGETPAVSNLNDILAAYSRDAQKTDQDAEVRVYLIREDTQVAETALLEKEIARLESEKSESVKKLAESEAKVKALEADKKAAEEKASALGKEHDALKAENAKLYSEKRTAEVAATLDKLVREKKIVPAQKDALGAILMSGHEERKFSVGGKEYKNANELVLAFVESGTAINTDLGTDTGEPKTNDLALKATKYAADNKVSYKEALIAVSEAAKK